ncbi:hypothetical protein GCK32_014650 [Trichostrongylus colubriformis]|uniref:Uncharacterized protein n=1 Tax=Trichostrongylus colubriformis TaxID=6319 RepID=A0AAN8FA03_TRICO
MTGPRSQIAYSVGDKRQDFLKKLEEASCLSRPPRIFLCKTYRRLKPALERWRLPAWYFPLVSLICFKAVLLCTSDCSGLEIPPGELQRDSGITLAN